MVPADSIAQTFAANKDAGTHYKFYFIENDCVFPIDIGKQKRLPMKDSRSNRHISLSFLTYSCIAAAF